MKLYMCHTTTVAIRIYTVYIHVQLYAVYSMVDPRSTMQDYRVSYRGRALSTAAMVPSHIQFCTYGTLERTIVEKSSLYESYVLNPPAVKSLQLRDANTNFRIDYTFQ